MSRRKSILTAALLLALCACAPQPDPPGENGWDDFCYVSRSPSLQENNCDASIYDCPVGGGHSGHR